MNRPGELDRLPGAPFAALANEQPDSQEVARIVSRIQRSLAPVRPLPSRRLVVGLLVVAFAFLSLLAALPFGYLGFNGLSLPIRLAYATPILLVAVALASSLDAQLIPGSRHLLSPRAVVLLAIVVLGLLTIALFPRSDMQRFVARGMPCFQLGTICAAISGALLALWIRRGYSLSAARTGAIAGAFAGLTGFAVLALHCPLQNAPHILLWHLGPLLAAAAAGTLLGIFSSR